MSDSDVILRWIQDRLNDEERAANATTPVPVPGRWRAVPAKHADDGAPVRLIQGLDDIDPTFEDYSTGVPVIARAADWQDEAEANLRHIARHDPARALREVAAKRRRLERHQPWGGNGSPVRCSTCGSHGESDPWPCDEVVDDAQSWADRDDMPEELRIT